MWFLYILSWISISIQMCVITLAIAAGLYYLAELAVEYTVLTSKVIRYMIIVLAYFTVCLWIVPFAFFVSLAANENVLPTMVDGAGVSSDPADVVSHYFNRKGKKSGLLVFLKSAQENILPQRVKKHF